MSEAVSKQVHDDLEALKRDVAVIKHILSEEGKLSSYAKKARATPDSEYVSHAELKKKILKVQVFDKRERIY